MKNNNETLQETFGTSTIVAAKEEEVDIKQDKHVEGDLFVSEDDVMKSEEGFNVDSHIARIDAKIKELEEKEKCLGAEEEKIIEFLIPDIAAADDEKMDRPFNPDDLKAKIDAMFAELERQEKMLGVEEEKILQSIKETLSEHHLKYIYDQDRPKMVEIPFGTENKPFRMQVVLQNEKVIFRLAFPFRVQCNSLALVTLYMAQFNENKAFSLMNLDMDDGEVTMEYSSLIGKADEYNSRYFWIYMTSLIKPSLDAYTRLQRLAVGKVSKDNKKLYKILLEKSLAVINGEEEDEDDIIFGSEDLKNGGSRRKTFLDKIRSRREHNPFEDDDFDFLEDDEEDGLKPSMAIPSLEEFMRMRAEAEIPGLDGEEKTKNEDGKKSEDEDDLFMPFEEVDTLSASGINE